MSDVYNGLRLRTFGHKKADTSTFSNPLLVSPTTPTLANPVRGFGLPTNNVIQTATEESTNLQEAQAADEQSLLSEVIHQRSFGHDISRISLRRPQAKLTVGASNDVYEQEADRVADQVMSMPDSKPSVQREVMPEEEEEIQTKTLGDSIQREAAPEGEEEIQTKPLAATITPLVQREAVPEEEEELQTKALGNSIQRETTPEEEEEIQTKRSPDAGFQAKSNLENRLSSSQGGGSPLPDEVRSFMEPRFSADFSQVRVHTGNEAVQMNQDLNAQAFTHKQDVYFGAGKAPGKDALTAHELTHVVQQTGAVQPKPIDNKQSIGLRDFDVIGNTLEFIAKKNFSVPLCRELINHYCYGKGTEFGLTILGMLQCNALIDFGDTNRSPQLLGFINQMGAEIARNANGDPSRLKNSIESDVSFTTLAGCNTSGTLGNFSVYAYGKLKVWNPNADGSDADWLFDGSMWWSDLWDFDKQPPPAKGQPGRTEKGEWRTMAGSLLVGVPFEIKTASVPVRQVRAEAYGGNHYAKWQGNTDGKLLPVVSGIL